jgi:serine/threonine protein kinase
MKIGKFDVLETLGTGAGSTVFKVRRHDDAKTYALKVVKVKEADDKRYIDQLQHEYNVASRFNHPHLCKIYAIELEKSLLGKLQGGKLLIEHVHGMPLSSFKTMSVGKLLVVFAKTAAGLAHMHALGVYHADVKPENILVTAEGDVRIIDFGVAWRRGEDKGRIQGTLDYLAPEQLRKKIANAKTDVFNLGATMYRMLAGRAIPDGFHQKGASSFGKLDDLVQPIVDLNPRCPPEIDAFVRKCLRYHPSERPASMKEVFRSLKEFVAQRKSEKRDRRDSRGASEA